MKDRPWRLILALGLLLRLAALFLYLSLHQGKGETWEYEPMAQDLLAGRGYVYFHFNAVYRSFCMPVMPVLYALLHRIEGPGLALEYALNLFCAAGILYAVYALARRSFGDQAALWALLLAAVEPGQVVFQSYKLDGTALCSLFFLTSTSLFLSLRESARAGKAAAFGLLAGAGMLVRPDMIGQLPVLATWLALEPGRGRTVAKLAVLALLGASAALAPWAIRNRLIQGRTILFTTTAGEHLWYGNNPQSLGSLMTADYQGLFSAASPEFRRRVTSLGELSQNDLLRSEALSYIRCHPARFLRRFARRFFYFWWFTPTFANPLYYGWLSGIAIRGYVVCYGLALGLIVVGIASTAAEREVGRRRMAAYLLSPVLAVAALHSIYYVEGRHRVLVMPLLLILAGQGLSLLGKQAARLTGSRRWLRPWKDITRRIVFFGRSRFCPVCDRSAARFRKFGLVRRPDAQCPFCGALERHRLVWLFLVGKTDLFNGAPKRVFHVAPEPCLEQRFQERIGNSYLTADIATGRAAVTIDITAMPYADRTFDVIYCSHVLEHVRDDRKAMREFFRTLRDDGWAVLLVPITADRTIEDPTVADPAERLRLFGQEDHFRRYGPDYFDRLVEAGFSVEVFRVSDLVPATDAIRMGLTEACGEIYFCRKRLTRSPSASL